MIFEDLPRIVVSHDVESKYPILYEPHDTAVSGHLGHEKAYTSVNKCYWRPKLNKWVNTYVRTCEKCQRMKPLVDAGSVLDSLSKLFKCW